MTDEEHGSIFSGCKKIKNHHKKFVHHWSNYIFCFMYEVKKRRIKPLQQTNIKHVSSVVNEQSLLSLQT